MSAVSDRQCLCLANGCFVSEAAGSVRFPGHQRKADGALAAGYQALYRSQYATHFVAGAIRAWRRILQLIKDAGG